MSPLKSIAMRKVISRQKGGILLVAISNIDIYAPDGTRKVEWDGCFFDIVKDDVIMYLLEAKKGRETKSSYKCGSALLDSIDRAGIRLRHGLPKIVNCIGYAYTRVSLKDVVSNLADQLASVEQEVEAILSEKQA